MKKIVSLFTALLATLAFCACSENKARNETSQETQGTACSVAPKNANGKTLVVYFSVPETSNPNNMTRNEDDSVVVINGEVLGNTQYMAYVIQKTVGADIFRIEPETPYTTKHDALVNLAKKEQRENARPKIKGSIANFDDYANVFVGYPNWWGDLPMILYAFFDEYDFSGKTIIPFNTHGGSGFSRTIPTIQELEPNAEVLDGKSISRDDIQDAEKEIVDWANSFGLNAAEEDAVSLNAAPDPLG